MKLGSWRTLSAIVIVLLLSTVLRMLQDMESKATGENLLGNLLNRHETTIVDIVMGARVLLPHLFKMWTDSSVEAQLVGCHKLWEQIEFKPHGRQEALVMLRGFRQVLWALDTYPDHIALQSKCMDVLAATAQWNIWTAGILGREGAIRAGLEAIRRHPKVSEIRAVMSNIGSFCDWDHENQYLAARLGAIELFTNLAKDNGQDINTQLKYQCFCSTLCQRLDLRNRMVQEGYIEHSLKAMMENPHGNKTSEEAFHYGEVIFVLGHCFMDRQQDREAMFDGGIVEHVVQGMRDEHTVELDFLGKQRMWGISIKMLTALAIGNTTHRDAIVRAAAVPQILAAMRDAPRPESTEITAIVTPGCEALIALGVGNPENIAAVWNQGTHVEVQNALRNHPEAIAFWGAETVCMPLLDEKNFPK